MLKEIKYLLRSRSLRFTLDCRSGVIPKQTHTFKWHGKTIYYRPGTSDTEIIYKILLKTKKRSEYWVPPVVDPKVILDIGGNIGISSIYLANIFSQARIFTFEPLPDNFAILTRNISSYFNIKAFPIALGRSDGVMEMYRSDNHLNFGGFSFYEEGSDTTFKINVDVRNVNSFLTELGINQVDMIKIDTEGSEYDIITSFNENILQSVKWIIGELHGERDFEVLTYLSKWFDIELKKSLKKRLFIFIACNKKLTSLI
ncbi:MAG: FkbM family methyltransferase [Nitrospirota bacterium]|jgi:FkbM family methyltransferase